MSESGQSVSALKERLAQKDAEIKALKNEIDSLKITIAQLRSF